MIYKERKEGDQDLKDKHGWVKTKNSYTVWYKA